MSWARPCLWGGVRRDNRRRLMKLYYMPGACSLASHITLRETGAAFDLDKVDGKQKRTERGADFTAITPKGYVPVLALDDRAVLTEGTALQKYIADQTPKAGLAPAPRPDERGVGNGGVLTWRNRGWPAH